MFKYIYNLILLNILFFSLSFPQEKIEILSENTNFVQIKFLFEQEPFNIIQKNNLNYIDFFLFDDIDKNDELKLPYKIKYIALPPEASLSIDILEKEKLSYGKFKPLYNSKLVYQDSTVVSTEKIFENSSIIYDKNIIEILGYTYFRNYYIAILKINNHFYEPNSNETYFYNKLNVRFYFSNIKNFKKSVSQNGIFDNDLTNLIINFDQAKNFKTDYKYLPNDNLDNWIDYSKDYVKLLIPHDGIYRITYNDLVSYGISPITIDPKSIKIFNKGVQKSIYVYGEDDNIFNQNDYIEFYGERNYDSLNYRTIVPTGVDYINYMNRYTDTSVYWLTWGGNYGKRVQRQSSILPSAQDTITSGLVKLHLESDARLWYYDYTTPKYQLPFWQENKVWTWTFGGHNSVITNTIPVTNRVPGSNAKAIARLISNGAPITSNAHKWGISLNNTKPQDSIMFDYRKTVNLSSIFQSSIILNGNNTLRLFGMPTAGSFQQVLIDWIDFEYFRNNVATNDSIMIIIPDTVSKAYRNLLVTNITQNDTALLVYKINHQQKLYSAFSLSSGSTKNLLITDTISGGDVFLIIKKSLIKTPLFVEKKRFVNLRDGNNGADYIIISHKNLQSGAENYKNFIQNNYNIRTKLIYVNDIYDEFSFGYLTAESIRSFLMMTHQNWLPPKPSYLLLLGDANYDYKNIISSTKKRYNLVPSYGVSVSDVWFTTFDPLYPNLQQMYVGRIPASTNEEIQRYLTKHSIYKNRKYDEFNKLFLFFSGGNTSNPGELQQIKTINDSIEIRNTRPAPIGGKTNHFYKTISPITNFGPFSMEYVQNAINESGLFISYIGHSGTQTWDNGITEVSHLKNKYANRFPLITDFGCSTGKFAEPDVDCFGEFFVSLSNEGQAISYFGNSSLGYTSTSFTYPKIFYEMLLKDTIKEAGRLHFLAKNKMLSGGVNDANRVFLYCNLLFGDPIISIQIPPKPNFYIKDNLISISKENPNDADDSLTVFVRFSNLGKVILDSFLVEVNHKFKDSLISSRAFYSKIPYNDSLFKFLIPVKNLAGLHRFSIRFNSNNYIDEIYYDDNNAEIIFNVYPTNLLRLTNDKFYTTFKDKISVLNPIINNEPNATKIRFQLADNINFNNPFELNKNFDTLFTVFSELSLTNNIRYYWRVKTEFNAQKEWSEMNSFFKSNTYYNWFLNYSMSERDKSLLFNIELDSVDKFFELKKGVNIIKVISAGWLDGSFASIKINGNELITNTFSQGIFVSIIDTIKFQPETVKYIPFNYPPDTLINLINTLNNGTQIILTICNDLSQMLGALNSPIRNAIKTLGSYYIDSVRYIESWCIIGRKGAPIGSVPEAYKKSQTGPAIIQISKEVLADTGYMIMPQISQSIEWKDAKIEFTKPNGASLNITPIGIKSDGATDTLTSFEVDSDSVSLNNIDAKTYPNIKLMARFIANNEKQSPTLKSIGVNYTTYPELAMNYQTVSVLRDTIYQGDANPLKFMIQNVSDTKADSVNITVQFIKADLVPKILLDTVITTFMPWEKRYFDINYKTNVSDGKGNMSYLIQIDKENKIPELYKFNNVFSIYFYVKPDTTSTSVNENTVKARFDGVQIKDGDYVAPNSLLEIDFRYPVWFPFTDTTALIFMIDGNKIPYSNFNVNYDSIERYLYFKKNISLSDGEHTFKIFGKNIYGKMEETAGFEINFKVTNDLKVEQAYNYPNPFSKETNFTFTLSQKPDELKIKIYTVTGRLIKEIVKTSNELSSGFNSIFWDGRDQDGDEIGNGVYFYKIIISKDDKTTTQIQKFAKIR